MATVSQIYGIVNDCAKEAYGEQAISVKDTASLVSLGSKVFSSDTDKDLFYHALLDRVGRTAIAARKYYGKKRSVKRDELDWGIVYQKISYKQRDAVKNFSWDSSNNPSPYEITQQTEAVQKLFSVMGTYEYNDRIPDYQLFTSFSGAAQMGAYISGIFINQNNALEKAEEELGKLAVNTLIAGVFIKGKENQARNALAEYNTRFSKSLTAAACMTDPDFLKYLTREILMAKNNMSEYTVNFNITDDIPRFTPEDKCVVEVLGQFASASKTYLQADTYHDEMVHLPRYEEVNCWQSPGTSFAFEDVSKIYVKNAELAVSGNSQGVCEQSGIIAVIRDYDAAASIIYRRRSHSMYDPRNEEYIVEEKADTGYMVDLSENAVVFYVADP